MSHIDRHTRQLPPVLWQLDRPDRRLPGALVVVALVLALLIVLVLGALVLMTLVLGAVHDDLQWTYLQGDDRSKQVDVSPRRMPHSTSSSSTSLAT